MGGITLWQPVCNGGVLLGRLNSVRKGGQLFFLCPECDAPVRLISAPSPARHPRGRPRM